MADMCKHELVIKKEDAEKYLLSKIVDSEEVDIDKESEKTVVDFNKLIPKPDTYDGNSYHPEFVYVYLSKECALSPDEIMKGNDTAILEQLFGQNVRDKLESCRIYLGNLEMHYKLDAIFKKAGASTFEELKYRFFQYGKAQFENFKQYGAKDRHEWCLQNWGTKWNAVTDEISEDGENVILQFQTADCPPFGIMEKLAEKADYTMSSIGWGPEFQQAEYKAVGGKVKEYPKCNYQKVSKESPHLYR